MEKQDIACQKKSRTPWISGIMVKEMFEKSPGNGKRSIEKSWNICMMYSSLYMCACTAVHKQCASIVKRSNSAVVACAPVMPAAWVQAHCRRGM